MKWYKRDSDYMSRADIGTLLHELGFKGIYIHDRTMEILAKEFDVEHPGQFSFNFKSFFDQFSRKIYKYNLQNYLNFAQKHKLLSYEINGRELIINCPEIKDLADEYTQKILKEKERLKEKSVGSKSRCSVGSPSTSTSSSKGINNNLETKGDDIEEEEDHIRFLNKVGKVVR